MASFYKAFAGFCIQADCTVLANLSLSLVARPGRLKLTACEDLHILCLLLHPEGPKRYLITSGSRASASIPGRHMRAITVQQFERLNADKFLLIAVLHLAENMDRAAERYVSQSTHHGDLNSCESYQFSRGAVLSLSELSDFSTRTSGREFLESF